MDQKQNAIKTSSKVISIIMEVFYIIMLVMIGISVTGIIFVAITNDTSYVTSLGLKILVTDESITTVEGVIALCSGALFNAGVLFVVFYLTHKMFKAISISGTPFEVKYVRTIKIIGILIVAMTILGGIIEVIGSNYADMTTLGMATDGKGILVGGLIFCLAFIIDYGCSLQKQSDETL